MGKRYRVAVSYSQTREIRVWAADAEEACAKAEAVVAGWDSVTSAVAEDVDAEEVSDA
jgi:hypothetical protein